MLRDAFGEFEVIRCEVAGGVPVVSVVMAVFNGAAYLKKSVKSLLEQDFKDFEFLIVDDGSSDGTRAILRGMQKADARIVGIVNRDNIGLTKSLIRAIALARGRYIARQDVDDASAPQRLSRQLAFFPEYDFVCARAVVDAKCLLPRLPWAVLYRWVWGWRNPCVHGTYMFKRSVYEKVGGYAPDVRYAQDYDLLVRILGDRSIRTKYILEPLYFTTKGEECISRKNIHAQRAAFKDIRQRRDVSLWEPFKKHSVGVKA